jgi:hypothetical protein
MLKPASKLNKKKMMLTSLVLDKVANQILLDLLLKSPPPMTELMNFKLKLVKKLPLEMNKKNFMPKNLN